MDSMNAKMDALAKTAAAMETLETFLAGEIIWHDEDERVGFDPALFYGEDDPRTDSVRSACRVLARLGRLIEESPDRYVFTWRAAVQLRRLRVLLRTHHFDSNEALVPFDPGVVSGRDCVRVTRNNGFLGPILHAHGDAPRNGESDMGNLA